MDIKEKEHQLSTIKDLILEGKITSLSQIFNYIDKKYIHTKTGINYYRLLRGLKNPKKLTFDDAYSFSRVLKVPAPKIAELIFNQLEAAKKASLTVKNR